MTEKMVAVPLNRFSYRHNGRASIYPWEIVDGIDRSVVDRCHTEARAKDGAEQQQRAWETKLTNFV